jgi:methyltransferase-like protein
MEQHIDFLTGRLFRRSLLVRRKPGGPARIPDPDRLGALHVASPIRPDPERSTDRLAAFQDDRMRPVTTGDDAVRTAFERLAHAYPATRTVDELTAPAAGAPAPSDADAARVRRAVLTMAMAGRASLSVLPLRVGDAGEARPRAWHVARAEAASGQPWITTLCHVGVPAHPMLRAVLPHLDGTNDRSALRARLSEAIRSGKVEVPELPLDAPPPSPERLAAIAEQYLEQTLRHLARSALLDPGVAQRQHPTEKL